MTNTQRSTFNYISAMARDTFVARLPSVHEVFTVYSVIVAFIYGWSLYTSFWRVPSWLYFLNFQEILSIYAYMFSVDLMESLLLLAVCLFLCSIFPASWWKQLFIPRSLSFMLIFLGSIMLRLYIFGSPYYLVEFARGQNTWWLISSVILILGIWLLPNIGWVRMGLVSFADRCAIFAYIFIPLSVLSLGIVVFRNTLGM